MNGMTAVPPLALAFVFALTFAPAAPAQESGAPADAPLVMQSGDTDLSEFIWTKRPVVVFADSENDPAFISQMEFLADRPEPLLARDVVIITDTDAETLSPLRKKLRPRGFMLVIIDKEGRIQLRKPFPWDVREISRSIDKLPIRQREIRDGKAAAAGG